jgi:chromosome segregation ATPase
LRAELHNSKEEHKKTVSDFEAQLQSENQTNEHLNLVILDLRQNIPTYLEERATFESRVKDLTGSLVEPNIINKTMK